MMCRRKILRGGRFKRCFYQKNVTPREGARIETSQEFIVVTHAANSFYDRFGMPVLMEEWMGKNIHCCRTPEEMLAMFQDDICENINSNAMQYGFIFGGFDKNGPYAQLCMVNNKTLTMDPKIRHKAGEPFAVAGGDGYYTNSIEMKLLTDSLKDCEISSIPSVIRECIGKMIASADRLDTYNPVGPPINVITLRPGI